MSAVSHVGKQIIAVWWSSHCQCINDAYTIGLTVSTNVGKFRNSKLNSSDIVNLRLFNTNQTCDYSRFSVNQLPQSLLDCISASTM